ncbi:hypothetical protein HMI01_22520 [Halolactibacillus miurensis]|uniref:CDP-glycerol glycerophosphotransferase n=1 Tax=Halolactibacillus miurensis TaxID=306541 RepID=A0A1I6UJA5_9BACI|nr:CDP-glycerol glycerophosphotransferase family protein [Halolactibacillus miurensis]GEM05264.1 hypothetical protein HMI01_22520 [Halolactibacillus miurensis]SFT01545.1 CDP-glycerol glycerophosphotransferase [Halolactibacillus miurensis]
MEKLRSYQSSLIIRIFRVLFKIFSFIPIKNNYIIFESFHGKQFSDNPRALFEFITQNYQEDYIVIWSVDRRYKDKFEINNNIKAVTRLTPKWCYYMSVSKYWVINARLPLWIPKRKENIYLQTWHGTPLKKLGLDIEKVNMPGTTTDKYKKNFMESSSKWDYLISPNSYSTNIFRSAFGFKGEILEVGYPRNDHLVNNNNSKYIDELKRKLKIPKDKKVILYAPTWRDDDFYKKGSYRFELSLDLEEMKKALGDKYVIILRMHYLISSELDVSYYENFVFDYSLYEDIRDLYLISDLLITDYSSVFFDFAILKKPIIFYMYDLEKYENILRGFYIKNLADLPGDIVQNDKDLLDALLKVECSQKDYQLFFDEFCSLEDGESSKRVYEKVFKQKKV